MLNAGNIKTFKILYLTSHSSNKVNGHIIQKKPAQLYTGIFIGIPIGLSRTTKEEHLDVS